MKLLVILLVALVFGLSAAAHDVFTGAGFVAAIVSYLVVGISVTFAGTALLVLREVAAARLAQAPRRPVMAPILAK